MTDPSEWVKGVSTGNSKPPPVLDTLGIKVVTVGDGKAKLDMRVGPRFHNPMGTLHGGIITDLADAGMGLATMSTLREAESFTTIELKMNFLRPVIEGTIVCESRVLHRGITIVLAEADVTNEEGKSVARGSATQLVLRLPTRK